MAIYRQIQTNFWQDGFVGELTPEEKYFYFYLLTNPRTTQCGISEINIRIMEAETGYNRETIEKLIKRFEEYGKIIYCRETREIIILNWVKYNFINSKNTICCINKELKLVKNKSFIDLLYKSCLKRGYDVQTIFKGVDLDIVEESKEDIDDNKIESSYSNGQTVNLDIIDEELDSDFNENSIKKQGLHRGFEGAYKDLGEEEEEKEKEIQKESYNKQKAINRTKGADAFCSQGEKGSSKLLMQFNKNIRQATIRDLGKLGAWRSEFEEEVIIQAMYQAVKYKARHTGYMESVLNNWKRDGVTTMEELKACRAGGLKSDGRCNADAYRYLD